MEGIPRRKGGSWGPLGTGKGELGQQCCPLAICSGEAESLQVVVNLTSLQPKMDFPKAAKGNESNEIAFLILIACCGNLTSQPKPHPLLPDLLTPVNANAGVQPCLIPHKPRGMWAKQACSLPSQGFARGTAGPSEPQIDKATSDHTLPAPINTDFWEEGGHEAQGSIQSGSPPPLSVPGLQREIH